MPAFKDGNVLSWAPDVDGKTLAQAHRTANMPFVEGHLALMPDAHYGFGSTVGSVIPTQGAIIPSAIGVDIGCGMIAAKLDLNAKHLPDDLQKLHSMVAKAIPAGVGQGNTKAAKLDLPETHTDWENGWVSKAEKQLGSLGGGNHFVEICLDQDNNVWAVLHSGSRGIGKEVAEMHISKAKGLMKKLFIHLEDPDLAYLVEDSPEFKAYITDMLWAQDYAIANRDIMMKSLHTVINKFMGHDVKVLDLINCHHNFTQKEHHKDKNLWITRKGAIRAREGDRGVIPGSMGARSYIVKGLGNPASYHSCSHGAGRLMSRAQAKKELSPESLKEMMKGKAWNNDPKGLLDEHPRAYRDIDTVMENQKDLVEVEYVLHQILNYKGL